MVHTLTGGTAGALYEDMTKNSIDDRFDLTEVVVLEEPDLDAQVTIARERAEAIPDFVEDEPTRPIPLETMAELVGMAPSGPTRMTRNMKPTRAPRPYDLDDTIQVPVVEIKVAS